MVRSSLPFPSLRKPYAAIAICGWNGRSLVYHWTRDAISWKDSTLDWMKQYNMSELRRVKAWTPPMDSKPLRMMGILCHEKSRVFETLYSVGSEQELIGFWMRVWFSWRDLRLGCYKAHYDAVHVRQTEQGTLLGPRGRIHWSGAVVDRLEQTGVGDMSHIIPETACRTVHQLNTRNTNKWKQ
jgi:hypothetical protein